MKTLYLIKAIIYFTLGLYFNTKESIIGGLFLGIMMFFFWLDTSIKSYINEIKQK